MSIFDRLRGKKKESPPPPKPVMSAAELAHTLTPDALKPSGPQPGDVIPVLRAKDADTGEVRLEINIGELIPFKGVWLKVTSIHQGGRMTVQLQEEEGGQLKKEDREKREKFRKLLRPKGMRGRKRAS